MTERIEEVRAHLGELEDDSCHKALWWTEDIRHLLSEIDAAKAENEQLKMQLEHCKIGRQMAAKLFAKYLMEGIAKDAENERLRDTIGHLVALLKNSSSQDNDTRALYGMAIARDGLTWEDAIGGDE